MYCFVNSDCSHLFDQASDCIALFIYQMGDLFGRQSCTYNIHVLSHLAEFVSIYGCLDNLSSFPFDDKKQIKSTNYIFQQTCNNLALIGTLCSNFSLNSMYSCNYPSNYCIIQLNNVDTVIYITSAKVVKCNELVCLDSPEIEYFLFADEVHCLY